MHKGGCEVERHWNDRDSAIDIVKKVIKNHYKLNAPGIVQVQKEMVDQKRDLDDTAAGKEVNAKIEQERAKFEKDLKRAR